MHRHRPLAPAWLRRRLAAAPPGLGIALALGGGAAAALAMEPWSLWPLAPLGLALLLLSVSARPEAGFGLGLAFGLAHFALGLFWIAEAFTFQTAMPAWMGWLAVAGLALFLALYPALAALGAGMMVRPLGAPAPLLPLSLALAGAFAAAEILRGLLFTGFAWNPLGAAALPLLGLAQGAALVGANGLSALVVLLGGAIAALADGRGERGRPLLMALLPLALLADLGGRALPRPAAEPDAPTFLLVQPGTGIADKHGQGGAEAALADALRLTREGLASVSRPPAAVIWPEATVEYPLDELPGLAAQLVAGFPPGTWLLTGGVALERDETGTAVAAHNSLFALDPAGRVRARYDKAHLVPGGEYLPLRPIAEPLGLARLVPGTLDFRPGPGPLTWRLPGLPALSPNICYEIIFPGAVVARADRPEAIVTVSNDAWFGPTGPPQHHAQARLRAIEEGLPVLRVTPTGVTGLIGPDGRMLDTLPRGAAGFLEVPLPQARAPTPFARLGLAAPLALAAALLLLAIAAARATDRRQP
jgi:apolipoprotein N-acyltransferase